MTKRERLTITLRSDLLKHVDHMIDGKEARNRSHAIETALAEKFGGTSVNSAIILGGGKGVSVNGKKTSPLLVKHGGKLLIERHIEKLKSIGVRELILAVGDFGDAVRDVVGDGAAHDLKVVYFEHDFGTAGALRQARSILKNTFIMFNGHIVVDDLDLEDMIVAHKNEKALMTMALVSVPAPESYGQVVLRGTTVTDYVEKPGNDKTVSHIVNAGVYLIESDVCQQVRPEKESLEKDVIPSLVADNQLRGYMLDVPWERIDSEK